MPRNLLLAVALVALCACATTSPVAKGPITLDATTEATANTSFQSMFNAASAHQQQQLMGAMIRLNLVGVGSAYEVVADPALQTPSIARIKDRVAGMTAEEIIALADRMSDAKVEIEVKRD